MHKKYGDKGLAVISVSLDPLKDKADAERFLVKQNATFTNLLLDEDLYEAFDTKQKFGFAAPPAQFVFDRQGKWVRFTSDEAEIDHAQVEKLIGQLLNEK